MTEYSYESFRCPSRKIIEQQWKNKYKRIKLAIMANHSETNIMTHFLTSLIELIFIRLETWSFSVSFLTHVFCVMPLDMCLLSDFKESEVNQNQRIANQWSQRHRKRQKEQERETDRLTKSSTSSSSQKVSGGMLW